MARKIKKVFTDQGLNWLTNYRHFLFMMRNLVVIHRDFELDSQSKMVHSWLVLRGLLCT